MASVVDDNIERRNVLLESPPKLSAGLISNIDLNPVRLICFARWLNIDPIDLAVLAEIVAPHLQTSTTVDAYFKNPCGSATESSKVAMIDIKIMSPFPYSGPFFPRHKEVP